MLSCPGKTPFDYFTRLATSFLHGKYYLTENPLWLTELIPAGANKFYVVYPPMPAILSIPFVFVLGKAFQQQFLGFILGGGIGVVTYLLTFAVTKNKTLAIWNTLLASFGSIIWFLSSVGSSWYLGHVASIFFLLLALYESQTKKRPILVGVFIGASYLSRIDTILTAPFIYFLLENKIKISRKIIGFVLGAAPFLIFNAVYNFSRFGAIWDKAYFLLPQILNETSAPWFYKGVINIAYIPNNIKAAFWSFPIITNSFPFIKPSWAGLSLWITTPAFIYALLANFKKLATKLSWTAIAVIFLFVAMHGGTGFAQFGYRFASDFYPFLIFLTARGISKKGLRWHHWLLLAISMVVNLWGVIWINKFGWVGY